MRIARGISIANASKPISTAPVYDADAAAFFTAASITDNTQKSAVNTLVLSLKSANIWTKMKALYPVVGGVASAHAVNLKQPGTFNLTFQTGWDHTSTGMTPNGATYADTNLMPSTALAGKLNDSHLSLYNRTNATSYFNATKIDPLIATQISMAVVPSTTDYGSRFMDDTYNVVASPNALGFYIGNRTLSTQKKYYKNGALGGTFNINSIALPDRNLVISGIFGNGYTVYSSGQCAFASIGDGLTDTDATNFYNAVQNYQTTLNRQV